MDPGQEELVKLINTIMSIWSFNRNIFPYCRVINHKARMCVHCGMQLWGVYYLETYFPVVNWVFFGDMFDLNLLIEIHTKLVYFVLAYTRAWE